MKLLRLLFFGGLLWWAHQAWPLTVVLLLFAIWQESLHREYAATLGVLREVQDEIQDALDLLNAQSASDEKPSNYYVFHTSTYGKVN